MTNSQVESLKRELQQTQSIATRKVQELSAEIANQRSLNSSLKVTLYVSDAYNANCFSF